MKSGVECKFLGQKAIAFQSKNENLVEMALEKFYPLVILWSYNFQQVEFTLYSDLIACDELVKKITNLSYDSGRTKATGKTRLADFVKAFLAD